MSAVWTMAPCGCPYVKNVGMNGSNKSATLRHRAVCAESRIGKSELELARESMERLRKLLERTRVSLDWMAHRGPDTDRDEVLLDDIGKELGDV